MTKIAVIYYSLYRYVLDASCELPVAVWALIARLAVTSARWRKLLLRRQGPRAPRSIFINCSCLLPRRSSKFGADARYAISFRLIMRILFCDGVCVALKRSAKRLSPRCTAMRKQTTQLSPMTRLCTFFSVSDALIRPGLTVLVA